MFLSSFKTLASIVFKYFADKEKWPNLSRAIIHEFFFRIYSKVIQVIYLHLPINAPCFKALAPTIFEIFADNVKMPKISKGHNS